MFKRTFDPLPRIDLNYEGNYVMYYPPNWSTKTTSYPASWSSNTSYPASWSTNTSYPTWSTNTTNIKPTDKCSDKKNCHSMIKASDPYIPKNIKRSTVLHLPIGDNSSSTSLDDVNLHPVKEYNPLLEELLLEEIPIVSTNSMAVIENEWEFKPKSFCGLGDKEIDNFVYSDPIYIDNNQTFREADNLSYDESENPLIPFTTYYDDNQILYDAIPLHGVISLYQGDEGYDFNNKYCIPEENITNDPFYVDPSMYQEALLPIINLNHFQTEYDQFYQGGPMVYATFHEYEMSNQFNDEQQIPDLSKLTIPSRVPRNSRPYLNPFEDYSQVVLDELLAKSVNSAKQFSKAPLQVTEWKTPKELKPRFSYYNSTSDEDKLEDCSTSEQSYLLETVIQPNTYRNDEIEVDTRESEEVELKVSDKTKENGLQSPIPEVDESNLQDMETQTICTPKIANTDSTPLGFTCQCYTKWKMAQLAYEKFFK